MSLRKEALSIDGLVRLLATGQAEPEIGYTGLYREFDAGVPTYECQLWRWKACARIEEPPGRMVLVANRTTWWRSWPVDEGVVAIPRTGDNWIDFDLTRFAGNEDPVTYWSDWLGRDPDRVRSSLQPTTHEGRPALRFTAPRVNGGDSVITVDADLGLVVRAEREDLGVYLGWSQLRTDTSLDEAFFTHSAEPPTRDDPAA